MICGNNACMCDDSSHISKHDAKARFDVNGSRYDTAKLLNAKATKRHTIV